MPNIVETQPIRGSKGATDPGPRNIAIDNANPDIFAPPETDNGSLPNLKFSFGMAHNRLEDGGWLAKSPYESFPSRPPWPASTCGSMRARSASYIGTRKRSGAYILQGKVRLTVVDENRGVFIDDLKAGDLWLIPAESPTRSRGSKAVANSCSYLTAATSRKTRRFSSRNSWPIRQRRSWQRTSASRKNISTAFRSLRNTFSASRFPMPSMLSNGSFPDNPPALSYTFHASDYAATKYSGGSVKKIDNHEFPETTLSRS